MTIEKGKGMTSKRLGVVAGFLGLAAAVAALPAAVILPTPAEETLYRQYTQHEALARFLSRVTALSPEAKIKVIGRTRETREFPSRELYLCILSEEGLSRPDQRNPAKLSVFITAGQHGNEQSAKEAALRLIRDIACGELKPLLKKANILIIPQTNPYGNFFDRRTNEQDLDMNRDHVKLETEGVAAIHRVFSEWLPEATIDVHEKGDDYYRVSIGCVSNLNIDPRIQEYSRKTILAEVERALAKIPVAFHEYLVTEELGVNTSAGAALRAEDLRPREMMKRYSTTDINDGRNSLGIYETLSFIQECSSRHDLATLAERTGWQYAGLRSFLESAIGRAEEVKSLVRESRRALRDKAVRGGADNPVHLKMDFARDSQQPELILKKFEKADSPILGILKADKKAFEPVAEEDLEDYPWPEKIKVVTEVVKNWFPRVEARLSVDRPQGYIIPAAQTDVVETLLRHGLEVQMFTADMSLAEEVYRVSSLVPARYDYLPPESLAVEMKAVTALVKKGDFFVSCRQPGANLIPCLLEPLSDFGLIRYQAYRLVPQIGDFFAIARYVGSEALPAVAFKNFQK
jgi:hypothetical protein